LIKRSELYDPNGKLIWVSEQSQNILVRTINEIDNPNLSAIVSDLIGQPVERGCTSSDILHTAEKLGYVSRVGSPPGFLTVLPRGTLLQHRINVFNRKHANEIGATRIDFPLL
jgi:hypothetical protein